jgi:2-oxoglutarate dehydrogenase E1 component
MSRQPLNEAFAKSSFLYGANAPYIEDMQARYEENPAAVDAAWRAFFEGLADNRDNVVRVARGVPWQRGEHPMTG